ncbi:hypothetical protein [Arthrobacter sp. B1I2]|uniref:hypothetical protein n=1 Tax=Arthrobacter sp. B1I2 TaxID=3042263 RepID=UPI00277E4915|nr:hypothetical protein [Arthrobacter sp. B1I2]
MKKRRCTAISGSGATTCSTNCAERAHHLGHADILRELIDGSAGQRPGDSNLSRRSPQEWAAHRANIEAAAREA